MNGEENGAGPFGPTPPLACARFASGADLPMNGEENGAGHSALRLLGVQHPFDLLARKLLFMLEA